MGECGSGFCSRGLFVIKCWLLAIFWLIKTSVWRDEKWRQVLMFGNKFWRLLKLGTLGKLFVK